MRLTSRVTSLLAIGALAYTTLSTGCSSNWVYVKSEPHPYTGDNYDVYRNVEDNSCDVVAPFYEPDCLIDYPFNDPGCYDSFITKKEVDDNFIEKLICECEGKPYLSTDFEPRVLISELLRFW